MNPINKEGDSDEQTERDRPRAAVSLSLYYILIRTNPMLCIYYQTEKQMFLVRRTTGRLSGAGYLLARKRGSRPSVGRRQPNVFLHSRCFLNYQDPLLMLYTPPGVNDATNSTNSIYRSFSTQHRGKKNVP